MRPLYGCASDGVSVGREEQDHAKQDEASGRHGLRAIRGRASLGVRGEKVEEEEQQRTVDGVSVSAMMHCCFGHHDAVEGGAPWRKV